MQRRGEVLSLRCVSILSLKMSSRQPHFLAVVKNYKTSEHASVFLWTAGTVGRRNAERPNPPTKTEISTDGEALLSNQASSLLGTSIKASPECLAAFLPAGDANRRGRPVHRATQEQIRSSPPNSYK